MGGKVLKVSEEERDWGVQSRQGNVLKHQKD